MRLFQLYSSWPLCLLLACQPADPAPDACEQPQVDKTTYIQGEYRDSNYERFRDSVLCLNIGNEGYGFGGGWVLRPTVWATAASINIDGADLPGTRRDYVPRIEIGFVFVPNTLPGSPGSDPPAPLRVGRYAWGGYHIVVPSFSPPPPTQGVEIVFRRSFVPGTVPDDWTSYGGEQGAESFFEITRLDPDPANEQLVAITGRFTVRLFGSMGRVGPSILLRNVQFRAYVERPEVVYRKL